MRGRFWSIRQTSLGDRRVRQGNECAQLDRPLRDGGQGNGVKETEGEGEMAGDGGTEAAVEGEMAGNGGGFGQLDRPLGGSGG